MTPERWAHVKNIFNVALDTPAGERAAFLEQSDSMLEMARVSGYGPWATFRRVALPLARPGIAAGVALALMETLADFGTVSYFGVQTFTTGIFRAWFSLGDHTAAAQLSAVLLAFVFAVLMLERLTRARAGFHSSSHRKALRKARGSDAESRQTRSTVRLLQSATGGPKPRGRHPRGLTCRGCGEMVRVNRSLARGQEFAAWPACLSLIHFHLF